MELWGNVAATKRNVHTCHITEDQHWLVPLTWYETISAWNKRNIAAFMQGHDVKKFLGHTDKKFHIFEAT